MLILPGQQRSFACLPVSRPDPSCLRDIGDRTLQPEPLEADSALGGFAGEIFESLAILSIHHAFLAGKPVLI